MGLVITGVVVASLVLTVGVASALAGRLILQWIREGGDLITDD